jgi:hypothetical protein
MDDGKFFKYLSAEERGYLITVLFSLMDMSIPDNKPYKELSKIIHMSQYLIKEKNGILE